MNTLPWSVDPWSGNLSLFSSSISIRFFIFGTDLKVVHCELMSTKISLEYLWFSSKYTQGKTKFNHLFSVVSCDSAMTGWTYNEVILSYFQPFIWIWTVILDEFRQTSVWKWQFSNNFNLSTIFIAYMLSSPSIWLIKLVIKKRKTIKNNKMQQSPRHDVDLYSGFRIRPFLQNHALKPAKMTENRNPEPGLVEIAIDRFFWFVYTV